MSPTHQTLREAEIGRDQVLVRIAPNSRSRLRQTMTESEEWHHLQARVLLAEGRLSKARAHSLRALELDPTSPLSLALDDALALLQGQGDREPSLRSIVSDHPALAFPRRLLAGWLIRTGRADEAVDLLMAAPRDVREEWRTRAALSGAMLAAGQRDAARAELWSVMEDQPVPFPGPLQIDIIWFARRGGGWDVFERMYERHLQGMPILRALPLWRWIAKRPRLKPAALWGTGLVILAAVPLSGLVSFWFMLAWPLVCVPWMVVGWETQRRLYSVPLLAGGALLAVGAVVLRIALHA